MKKILIFLFTFLFITGCSKKDIPTTPTPVPIQRVIYDTITAVSTDPTKGTVDPATQIMVKGATYHLNFNPKYDSLRTDTLRKDGKFFMEMNGLSYYNDNADTNHAFAISFTSNLPSYQYISYIDSISKNSWHDVYDSSKPSPFAVFPGGWSVWPIPSCYQGMQETYAKDGTYKVVMGSNPCYSDSSTLYGTWKLSLDGKYINYTSNDYRNPHTWKVTLLSVTDLFLITTYDDGRTIYKYVQMH